MLNPFSKFHPNFIPAFRKINKRYLVSQTFTRENNLFKKADKKYLFLTYYNDAGLAKLHHNAVAKDQFAAILDLEKEDHRNTLLKMLQPESEYIIYSSLITDPKVVTSALNKGLKKQITTYISTKTNWRIGRDLAYKPKIELTFGELFVVMKYGSQTIRIRLEEIENL